MAGTMEVVGLALGITICFASVAINIYSFLNNALLKVRLMRILSPGKNYGVWGIKEPGKAIMLRVTSFKTTQFKDGERVFPMPGEEYIERLGNAPFVLFDSRDAKAILLKGEKTDEVTRDPGKLHAFCDLYTALAEASARRKNKLNVKSLMMLLYIIVALQAINIYFGYAIQDYLAKNLPAVVQAAGTVAKTVTGIR